MPKKNNPSQQVVVEPKVTIPSGYYYLNDEFILIKAEGFPGVIKMRYTGDLWNWWYDDEVVYTEGKLVEKTSKVGSMYPMNGNDAIPEVDNLRKFIKKKGDDFRFDMLKNMSSINGTKIFI